MWDKIKKAINSNLAKPLDVLLGELYNSHRTDIVNTWNKANEANGNAWNSLQKGQEIVNMMNDTGGKRYTVVRKGEIYKGGGRFDYFGSPGIIRGISGKEDAINNTNVYIDGVQISLNVQDCVQSLDPNNRNTQYEYTRHLEFKQSITIINNTTTYDSIYYLIQTER